MKIALFAVAGLASVAAAQNADIFRGPFNGAGSTVARPAYHGGGLSGADSTLWDNGGFETRPGFSELQTGDTIFGYGNQSTLNNFCGDDFVVSGGGWNVTQLCFFGYQTGSTTAASTFTSVTWTIYSGLIGDTTTPVGSGTGLDASTWTGVYRVTAGGSDTNRPIFRNEVNVGLSLADGNYWVAWAAAGSLGSGPWAPPVTPAPGGANGVQSIGGAAYAAVLNGTHGDDFPFVVKGTPVPAPASLALVGLGGLIAGRRRR